MSRVVLAQCRSAAGRFEDACTECRRILEHDENNWGGYSVLAVNLLLRERSSEELTLAEPMIRTKVHSSRSSDSLQLPLRPERLNLFTSRQYCRSY
jgi:hypothetical protein